MVDQFDRELNERETEVETLNTSRFVLDVRTVTLVGSSDST